MDSTFGKASPPAGTSGSPARPTARAKARKGIAGDAGRTVDRLRPTVPVSIIVAATPPLLCAMLTSLLETLPEVVGVRAIPVIGPGVALDTLLSAPTLTASPPAAEGKRGAPITLFVQIIAPPRCPHVGEAPVSASYAPEYSLDMNALRFVVTRDDTQPAHKATDGGEATAVSVGFGCSLDVLRAALQAAATGRTEKNVFAGEGDSGAVGNLLAAFQKMGLSTCQSKVARLAAGGMSNKEVAQELFIHIATVKSHMTDIFRLLGIKRRSQLLARLTGDADRARRQ